MMIQNKMWEWDVEWSMELKVPLLLCCAGWTPDWSKAKNNNYYTCLMSIKVLFFCIAPISVSDNDILTMHVIKHANNTTINVKYNSFMENVSRVWSSQAVMKKLKHQLPSVSLTPPPLSLKGWVKGGGVHLHPGLRKPPPMTPPTHAQPSKYQKHDNNTIMVAYKTLWLAT